CKPRYLASIREFGLVARPLAVDGGFCSAGVPPAFFVPVSQRKRAGGAPPPPKSRHQVTFGRNPNSSCIRCLKSRLIKTPRFSHSLRHVQLKDYLQAQLNR